jgi:hypothetical protein
MTEFVELDAVEHAVEIEMPPGPAELAVGRELEADRFLLANDLFDLAILDRGKLGGADRARRGLLARLLEDGRSEQRADMVGAKRRLGAGSHGALPDVLGRNARAMPAIYTIEAIGSGGAWPMWIAIGRDRGAGCDR